MLIANPIYDGVFKFMMEDNEVATGFISTIINKPIIHLEFKPQENYSNLEGKLTRYSLDFIAKIKDEDGQYKDVLIELQKSSSSTDILRFRRYLGNQYKKANAPHDSGKTAIPIITIYILGYMLDDAIPAVLKVNRSYIDILEDKEVRVKNDFIECLTHDSYIIQIPKLSSNMQHRLDYILSVFRQENFYGEDHKLIRFDFDVSNSDEVYKKMVNQLGKAAADEALMRQLETDELVYLTFGIKLEKFEKQLAAQEKVIEANAKALEEERLRNEVNVKALEEERLRNEANQKKIQELLNQLNEKDKP